MERTRLKTRPGRRGDDPAIRDRYRAANSECEVSDILIAIGAIRPGAETPVDVHHIVGGHGGRKDVWSNLLAARRRAHDWLESNPRDGRIVCLLVKWWKGEIDPAEFRYCSGQYLIGWLQNHPPHNPDLTDVWREMVRGLKTWKRERIR